MTAASLAHPAFASRPSPAGLALVVLAHGAILALLLILEVVPAPAMLTTLTVDLIQPAPPAEIPLPRPRPVERHTVPQVRPRPIQAPPVLARETTDSAATSVPMADRTPPAPPAPQAVAEPRFDAAYLNNPPPAYPPLSRRLGEEGRTLLRVLVGADGHPTEVQINRSSGSPRLDNAAAEAIGRWKFLPARRGDETVAAWVLVPIAFSLKD